MPNQTDADYFLKREVQEREAAASSTDRAARAAHRELADRYADAAWCLEAELDRLDRPSLRRAKHDVSGAPVRSPL